MDLQTGCCFNPLMLCRTNKCYFSRHRLGLFVCFFFNWEHLTCLHYHSSLWLRAVLTRISIQAFHYLLMCIISLQIGLLNNMELATLLYKQIQSKLSLSRSIHFSLWLSWDLWCSDVFFHFRLKAATVYLCSYLKAAKLPFLWAKAKWHHISIFFICYDCLSG